ncbi:MAG TPA: dihydropteroate synthase [Burkholderiaceae bacterium]|jgi:dihydropteroate synthase|nr:dihydropteroate synthase [Burkholderiaceae bacterium]
MIWQTRRFRLALARPLVMGIVNVTPDSFSDGGRFAQADAARAHCDLLVAQGADILDIGGESTRPGARLPDTAEQLARVRPVLEHAVTLGVPVSVDTADPVVMREALAIGVDILNDVRALQAPGALAVAASDPAVGVCLMHMQGEPGTMQADPHYEDDDVVGAVAGFLAARRDAAIAAGIARERIALDPGIGFGKTPAHNIALAVQQRRLLALGCPLLLGWSRKSTLGVLTGKPVGERLAASVAAALAAVQQGASVVRVHDVAETVDALKTWRALAS